VADPLPAQDIWRERPVRGGYPDPGVLSLRGKERLQGFRRELGPAPPLFHLTGSRPVSFGEGTADAEMPASGWLANSAGLIGGGTLAVLADIAFGCSLETQVPARHPYTTAELSMTFLRPVKPGGMLSAHGQLIRSGRRMGLTEVFVLEGERMIAHGTSRLSILPAIEDLPEPPERVPYTAPEYPTPDPYLRPAPGLELGSETWAELDGLEVLRRQIAGELPAPAIHHLTGMRAVAAERGRAVAAMPCSEWLASPARRLQGGTIAMLADFAMMLCVLSTAPAGTAIAGVDLKVNFLRPVMADDRELTATAEIEHSGRTLAISRCQVMNADGKPVLLATGTSMYLPGEAMSLGSDVELGETRGD
jgi:uncharacterized protein (TIGR00369 family)